MYRAKTLFTIIDFMTQDQDQDQDQDFHFCPRGASRPRPWSRGLHHWIFSNHSTTNLLLSPMVKEFWESVTK